MSEAWVLQMEITMITLHACYENKIRRCSINVSSPFCPRSPSYTHTHTHTHTHTEFLLKKCLEKEKCSGERVLRAGSPLSAPKPRRHCCPRGVPFKVSSNLSQARGASAGTASADAVGGDTLQLGDRGLSSLPLRGPCCWDARGHFPES